MSAGDGRGDDLPDLIRRAGAILARETPVVSAPPRDPVQHRVPAPGTAMGGGALPLEELRRRAVTLVEDLFASLGGAAAVGAAPLASPVGWVSPVGPVPAGRVASLSLSAQNPTTLPATVSFYSTDLLSDAGWSVPGYLVSFEPARLLLAPGQPAVVTARIDVPLQTTPGRYAGLVQAAGLPALKLVLSLDVK